MNVARFFRWFPVAVGRKNEPTFAEIRKALASNAGPAPHPKYGADRKKLRHSRLKAELERKRA